MELVQEILYVKLKNYHDLTKSIYISNDVNEFINILNENNNDYSILEYLKNNDIRVYLDIDKIPLNDGYIIYKIIEKFIKMYKLSNEYTLTINENSYHEGLSFHLFFPYRTTKEKCFTLVKNFIEKYQKFKNYIDINVYNQPYFRCVNMPCPGYLQYNRSLFNKHELIYGEIEDTVIQNYELLPHLI